MEESGWPGRHEKGTGKEMKINQDNNSSFCLSAENEEHPI